MKMQADRFLSASFLAVFLAGSSLGQATGGRSHGGSVTTAPATKPEAPATKPEEGTDSKASRDPSYVIGNDDLLGINVWNQPEFKQSIPVRPDGKISLPLIGDIQGAGQTPQQLQEAITKELRAYMTNPEVTVMVLRINSQNFNILGRVAKPGSYPLTATTTVLDAIARAGGFQDFAKQKDIYVLREKPNGSETRIHFNYKEVILGQHTEENIRLKPGDTVIVP